MRIFLSQKSKNKPLVREFRKHLPRFLATWLDEDSLTWGTSFPEALKSAMQASVDFLIAFLDEDALSSPWVLRELEWAIEREKELERTFVLPILLDPIASLPAWLSDRQHLRLDGDYSANAIAALAKRASEELFHLIVDCYSALQLDILHSNSAQGGLKDSSEKGTWDIELLSRFLGRSKFSQRLMISSNAKQRIAEYCASGQLFQKEDVVFIESGTISVYIILELIRQRKLRERCGKIITNNVAVALIAMLGHNKKTEPAEIYYPLDEVSNVILSQGVVLEDYAATLPRSLLRDGDSIRVSKQLMNNWAKDEVSHMIMMVTRLCSTAGPCAVSPAMRSFKRTIMKYVLNNSDVRLSILAEGEKLASRRGDPAASDYWRDLISTGRVTLITALSPNVTEEAAGVIKRDIRQLSEQGLKVILLNDTHETVFEGESDQMD